MSETINVKINNNFRAESNNSYDSKVFIDNIKTAMAILDKRGVLYSLSNADIKTRVAENYVVEFNFSVEGFVFELDEEDEDFEETEELTEEELAEIIQEADIVFDDEMEDATVKKFFYRVMANGWLAEADLGEVTLLGSVNNLNFEQKLIIIENLCQQLLGQSVVYSEEEAVRDILSECGFDFDFDFDSIRGAAE